MHQPPSTSIASPPQEAFCDRQFLDWLHSQQISLACTTYQTSRLMLLGVNPEGRLSVFERLFDRAMGLYATSDRLYLSSKYQLWQFDNVLKPGQLHNGYDKLYIPRIGYTTGDLDIHDIAVAGTIGGASGVGTLGGASGVGSDGIIFVSTLLNCLATVSPHNSCTPLWKPPFISKIINEDRCHLNGLAMVNGQPRYVTTCSRSDVVDGWRDKRRNGGCIIDVPSNEIILSGLSMPHSPRFYDNKLWLHNSGSGEFGYVDLQQGKFEPVTFCPGYLRGLAFWQNYAIVGLSKPRGDDKTFSGLALDEQLFAKDAEPRCGFMVIDLNSGAIVHWLRFENLITELYDVQVIPGAICPMALGFQSDEISQIITFDPISPLFGSMGDRLPENAAVADNLARQALALQNQGKLDEAIALYQHLIAQHPRYAPAWYQLGVIMFSLGQNAEALRAFSQALTINPNYAEAHNNLGRAKLIEGDPQGAIACFSAAIKSNPDYAFAHNNLGLMLQGQGNLNESSACFQQALQKKPDYPEAHFNLGKVLSVQGNLDGAKSCFESAIRLKPDYIKAYNNLGLILAELDRFDEAIAIFQQVLAIQPNSAETFAHVFRMKEMVCDWRSRSEDLTRLFSDLNRQLNAGEPTAVNPFDALSLPTTAIQQLAIARNYSQVILQQWALVGKPITFTRETPPPSPRSRTERLRIGYLSNDFRYHATSHLMRSLFGLHDRNNFEIFAYSFGPDDNSDYRRRIANDCDRFVDIAGLSVFESARRIFEDRIHILVDLKGYTPKARTDILALRPAPIQVNYLGYPGTMGAEFIDYLIGDPIVTPPELAHAFSEQLVILPHSYQVNDYQQPIADIPVTRSEYNLPESGFVFCCFNHNYKIEPLIFDVWMKILAAVPGSVLWLLPRVPAVVDNLRREAVARGIHGDRLIFSGYLPKSQHLARHGLADLFLDTYFVNAHTTASDALWAGLPVLTCPGKTFVSRVAASLLTAVGLPELIVSDLLEYENLAIHLARSPVLLQQLKSKLAANRTTFPLFDTPRFVRNLERAYLAMWDIYADGKSPQAIASDLFS